MDRREKDSKIRQVFRKDPVVYDKYILLREKVEKRQDTTAVYCALACALNLAFGVWALWIYFDVEGDCERPLHNLICAIGISFLFAGVSVLCTCLHVRTTFKSFIATGDLIHSEHTGAAEPTVEDYDNLPSSHASMIFASMSSASKEQERRRLVDGDGKDTEAQLEDEDDDSQAKSKNMEKDVSAQITDSIMMACCSCTYLVCAFIIGFSMVVTALAWVYWQDTNCGARAESLQNNIRIYVIAFLGSMMVQILWYRRSYSDCTYVWDIHFVQQGLVKHLDKNNRRKNDDM